MRGGFWTWLAWTGVWLALSLTVTGWAAVPGMACLAMTLRAA